MARAEAPEHVMSRAEALDNVMARAEALDELGWQAPCPDIRLPAAGEVHLYLVHVPGPDLSPASLLERLTPAERRRADEKRVADKRREFITGQATLRTLLARMLSCPPGEVTYRRGPKGKPYVGEPAGDVDLQFNITHSGAVVVAAFAVDAELGVDVEWHNERTSPERVARRAFTDDERRAMAALPAQARRDHFFRMWTCKEALVKCTGLGIHSGMASFQVELEASGARVTGAWNRQAGVERLTVCPLKLGPGHAGALVHEPPAHRLRCFQLPVAADPLKGL